MSTMSFEDLKSRYGGSMPSAGGGGAPTDDEPLVFMGIGKSSKSYKPAAGPGYGEKRPMAVTTPGMGKVGTINQAIQKFDKMSFTEQRNMLRLLALGGFAGAVALEDIDEAVKGSTQIEARNAYIMLLETASDYFMNTNNPVTPEQVLRSSIAYRLRGTGIKWDGNLNAFDGGVKAGIGKDAAEPFSQTTTYKSVDVLNPKNAKGMVRSVLQSEMGRDPTQAEYEDFISALMAAERQNPDVTTTTSNYGVDDQGQNYLASQTSSTKQGINEEGLAQMAVEKARRQPGWAEWQAMGTYAPALYSALGSAVPGV